MKKLLFLIGVLASSLMAKDIESISALKLGTDLKSLNSTSYKLIGQDPKETDLLKCMRSNEDLKNNNSYLNIGFSDIVYCFVDNKLFSIEYEPSNKAYNELKIALEKEFDRQFVIAKSVPSMYITDFGKDREITKAITIKFHESRKVFLLQDIALYDKYRDKIKEFEKSKEESEKAKEAEKYKK